MISFHSNFDLFLIQRCESSQMQNRELQIFILYCAGYTLLCADRKLHQDITFSFKIHLCHSVVAQSHKA